MYDIRSGSFSFYSSGALLQNAPVFFTTGQVKLQDCVLAGLNQARLALPVAVQYPSSADKAPPQ